MSTTTLDRPTAIATSSTTHPDQCLKVFDQAVRATRQRFLQQLAVELPPNISKVAITAFCQRCERHGDIPLLAEYLPYLCADALDFRKDALIAEVANAWLHVYTAITMLDDVIDNQALATTADHLVVGTLLFQRGLSRIHCISNMTANQTEALDRAFLETAEAHLVPPKEFHDLGRKAAALIGPAETFLQLMGRSGQYAEAQVVRKMAACVGTAWQNLDDITDFEEDFRAGRATPLLRHAGSMPGLPPSDISRDQLLAQLIKTDALTEALTVVQDHFREAHRVLGFLRGREDSTLRTYLAALLDSLDETINTVHRARRVMAAGYNPHSTIILITLKEVQESLDVVAQGS